MKDECSKCKKSLQVSSCHGCEQTFCGEHVREHRHELTQQLQHIIANYQDFENEFNRDDLLRPYFSRIERWEHESISKVQQSAERARDDLRRIHERLKSNFKSSIDQISTDIQHVRQVNDYTEIDLKKWRKQLKQLQHVLKTSFTEDMIDDSQSSTPMIQVIDKNHAHTSDGSDPLPRLKFDRCFGKIRLSSDKQIVKCTGSHWNGSTICCNTLYVSGIHKIRFRINQMGKQNPFFGIVSTLEDTNPWNRKTPFAYGWWKIPWDREKPTDDTSIRTGDEMTLTVNCTNNEIELENHRTNQYTFERVAYEKCPFPWKIAIVLYSPGDSISIVS